ncbi:MAG: glycosyltransferase family 4 protein [Anaerolineae bacterium]|nr:glycosyltransferase family 4 protein [Anaerolineae bacterium]
MRIALIIYGSIDSLSGGYLYDRKMVAYLRAQGDEVNIISLPWQGYSRHLAHNLDWNLKKRLEDLPVDILLQDELNHPSLFLLNRLIRARRRYPILSIVHHLRSNEEFPAFVRFLYRLVERAYLKGIDGFLFNSNTTRRSVESLIQRPAAGVVAYPAGDRFPSRDIRELISLRSQQNAPLRLLFIGNLIRRKGLHVLVAALELVKEAPWNLDVVGRVVDPTYEAEIRHQIQRAGLSGRVNFLGELDDTELPDLFLKGHILVAPSYYEGFGIVYLEGMAFGLPAIASSAGGAVEIVEDGINGFLLDPGDVKRLAGLIQKFCQDRESLRQMSLQALIRFRQFPSWDESAAKARQFLLYWKGSSP